MLVADAHNRYSNNIDPTFAACEYLLSAFFVAPDYKIRTRAHGPTLSRTSSSFSWRCIHAYIYHDITIVCGMLRFIRQIYLFFLYFELMKRHRVSSAKRLHVRRLISPVQYPPNAPRKSIQPSVPVPGQQTPHQHGPRTFPKEECCYCSFFMYMLKHVALLRPAMSKPGAESRSRQR